MIRATLRFHTNSGRGSRDADTGLDGPTGAYLDALELRNAIIGDELVLEERPLREFVLHEVVACRARELGRFHGAADAWIAIDPDDSILIRYQRSRGRRARMRRTRITNTAATRRCSHRLRRRSRLCRSAACRLSLMKSRSAVPSCGS